MRSVACSRRSCTRRVGLGFLPTPAGPTRDCSHSSRTFGRSGPKYLSFDSQHVKKSSNALSSGQVTALPLLDLLFEMASPSQRSMHERIASFAQLLSSRAAVVRHSRSPERYCRETGHAIDVKAAAKGVMLCVRGTRTDLHSEAQTA